MYDLLPDELKLMVNNHLDTKHKLMMREVNKDFKNIAEDFQSHLELENGYYKAYKNRQKEAPEWLKISSKEHIRFWKIVIYYNIVVEYHIENDDRAPQIDLYDIRMSNNLLTIHYNPNRKDNKLDINKMWSVDELQKKWEKLRIIPKEKDRRNLIHALKSKTTFHKRDKEWYLSCAYPEKHIYCKDIDDNPKIISQKINFEHLSNEEIIKRLSTLNAYRAGYKEIQINNTRLIKNAGIILSYKRIRKLVDSMSFKDLLSENVNIYFVKGREAYRHPEFQKDRSCIINVESLSDSDIYGDDYLEDWWSYEYLHAPIYILKNNKITCHHQTCNETGNINKYCIWVYKNIAQEIDGDEYDEDEYDEEISEDEYDDEDYRPSLVHFPDDIIEVKPPKIMDLLD